MPEVGDKYHRVMEMAESFYLGEEYVDAAKAKNVKMFPKKPEEPYGSGDPLSNPKRDRRSKDPVPPQQDLPDSVIGALQAAFVLGGLDGRTSFQSPKYAYAKVVGLLTMQQLGPLVAPEEEDFDPERKTLSFQVARHNTEGEDHPIPTNRTVVLSWVPTETNQFSVDVEIR